MTTINRVKILRAEAYQRSAIVSLLQSDKLPTADLPPSLEHFFVATQNNKVIGAIGLEPYGDCGLLRSAVVAPAYRSKGVASHLVESLETLAVDLKINCLYLLTETAPDYFERKGFCRIARDQVPSSIQASTEFTCACPASAVVMRKTIAQA